MASEFRLFGEYKEEAGSGFEYCWMDIWGRSEYVVSEQLLGRGKMSEVWLGYQKQTREKVAIKMVAKEGLNVEQHLGIQREVTILQQIKHSYIIRIREFFEDEQTYYIVFDHMQENLLHFLRRKGKSLCETEVKRIFTQVLQATHYLHTVKGIVHRDIKLENVLLDENENIRLSDFGFASFLPHPQQQLNKFCGSLLYASPEIVSRIPYREEPDVWSLGVLLFTLLFRRFPFSDKDPLVVVQHIRTANILFRKDEINQISWLARDFLAQIFSVNHTQRPSTSQLLLHRWINS